MGLVERIKFYTVSDKLIYVWSLVVIGSNLQVLIHPHLDWALALLFFVLSWRSLLRHRLQCPWELLIGSILIVSSVCMTAAVSDTPAYDLRQAVKLVTILVAGLSFFITYPRMAKVAFRTQIFVVFANVALILVGSRISPSLGRMVTVGGRWETPLNAPGTLGAVGLGVLVYGLYLSFYRESRQYGTLLAACSLALIYFENSRTITPLAIVAIVFAIGVYIWENMSPKRALGVVALVCVGLLAFAILGDILLPTRFARLIQTVRNDGIIAGLAKSDPARATMMEVAFSAVSSFPLLGKGMGSLVAETRHGWMRVHMAYFQMWADAGLLAFLGLVWLAVGWVGWVPSALRQLKGRVGSEHNALVYNAMFMLTALAFSHLLHTYSTEWAQWLPYLVSVSFIYNSALLDNGVAQDELYRRDRYVQSTSSP